MENLEFEKMDELLRSKSFEELSNEEKLWVEDQVGDESAYTSLRVALQGITSDEIPAVPGSIKISLVETMKAKNAESQSIWYNVLNYRIPAYAGFLALLFIMTVYTFIVPPEELVVEKMVEIPSKPVIDTVFLQSKPDTIFIEKIVKKHIYLTREIEKADPEKSPETLSGKSLADQEDIRSLLSRLD